MASDRDNTRSTIGYVFTVGGITVSWVSKIQSVVAISTTKAEYVAATEASKEMIWLQRFMDELGKKHDMGTLYSDIQSVFILQGTQNFIQGLNTYHVVFFLLSLLATIFASTYPCRAMFEPPKHNV